MTGQDAERGAQGGDPRPCLLVIDDDATWRAVVGRALAGRGYEVLAAESGAKGLQLARSRALAGAIVDLRLPNESGLDAVAKLHALSPNLPIVVLTGFASIATAVEAVKLGATHYLAKPVEVDAILRAFGQRAGDAHVAMSEQPLSVERLEWEYIHTVLLEHAGNLSATARSLGMHRRTLQRKLAKHPPRR
jgi:two-component system response regulator RegA